jgi:hypothetical protein
VKWFDKWLKKKCLQAWNSRYEEDTIVEDASIKLSGRSATINSRGSPSKTLDGQGMQFSVFRANGGYVIQHYGIPRDSKGGYIEVQPNLTLVPSDDDLGTAIAHIITMESLKN